MSAPIGSTDRDAQFDLDQRLSVASLHGEATEVRELLLKGACPSAFGSASVQMAAERGNAECLALLLAGSLPVDDCSRALASAARGGHADCVKLLIPVASPSAHDFQAIRLAAEAGDAECVKLLIPSALGGGPQATIPALLAAASNGHPDCLRLLAASSSAPRDALLAALGLAACFGHESCAIILLPLSGSLLGSASPLDIALRGGHVGIVSAMLAHEPGIAPLLCKPKNLARARRGGHRELALLLASLAESQSLAGSCPPAPASLLPSPRL